MVVVPVGTYRMGSPKGTGDDDERPDRAVNIAKPFAVSIAPITRGQFAAFVAATKRDMSGVAYGWTGTEWKQDKRFSWSDPGFPQGDDHPVTCVNCADAEAYAKWLQDNTGGKDYRLLSEAEWEYCCRVGEITAYSTGDTINKQRANFGQNEKGTTPVSKYPANKWGLRDMHGNVWEWCADNWHASYEGNPPTDGSVWQGGDTSLRVLRGGSWSYHPVSLRSANRFRIQPGNRFGRVGFRLARTL